MEELQIRTQAREAMTDITGAVRTLIHANGWSDGAILLYCPHTTGAITIKMGDMQYPKESSYGTENNTRKPEG